MNINRRPKKIIYFKNAKTNSISVIICTEARDRLSKVRDGLRSLKDQTFSNFDVIVVDARNDEKLDSICKRFSHDLKLIRIKIHRKNLAYSRNIGISYMNNRMVAFMDDDAVADRYWIENIRKDFRSNTNFVGVAGKILSINNNMLGRFSERIFDYGENIKKVNTITGANMSFDITRVRNLKGFDRQKIFNEEFPFAGEETDACFYIRSKGGKLLFDPRVVVKHHFPSDFGKFIQKHILYGAGDYVVMSKPEYSRFSQINDYIKALRSGNNVLLAKVFYMRCKLYIKSIGILWTPLIMIKETAYLYGLHRSFLKDSYQLK